MTAPSVDYQQRVMYAKQIGEDPPPLDETRIRVRVVSRTHGQVVGKYATYVEYGENVYEIYKVDLPEFTKLLETASPAERDFAQKQYERDLEDAEGKKAGVEGREYRKQHDPSLPAAFRDLYRRDMLPFDLVEATDLPVGRVTRKAPPTDAELEIATRPSNEKRKA